MAMVPGVPERVLELRPDVVTLRRRLHEMPELAFEEHRTAQLIASRLRELGVRVEEGIGGTGVLGLLEGARAGEMVMLRADMDALPLPEPEGRPYRSKVENRNHACGHDFNMAIVLTAAQVLAERRDTFAGSVAFVFQPADEPQTGATRMLEDGLLERTRPSYVIAQHAMDSIPTGSVIAQPGPIWASTDLIKMTIAGRRAEFDRPHTGVDAPLAAAQVVSALYAMVHRESPPRQPVQFRVTAMQSVTQEGGVPAVELTMRLATFDKTLQQQLMRRVEELASGIARGMGASVTLSTLLSHPPVVNDETVAEALVAASAGVVGPENVVSDWRNWFSDDIAEFTDRVPGAVFCMGTHNAAKGTGRFHQPDYDVDEDALVPGVEIMVRATLALLQSRS